MYLIKIIYTKDFPKKLNYVIIKIFKIYFSACIPVTRTLIIVETLGLDKLTNSVGLLLMFQGITSLIGISFSGYLRGLTGDYKCSFYFAGISLVISGLVLIPLKEVNSWEKKRKHANPENNLIWVLKCKIIIVIITEK